MAVAVILLGLCASPVTAPFSTFSFCEASHDAISFTQKIAESLKTGDHDVVATSMSDQVTGIACLGDAAASPVLRFPGGGSVLHVVLRI